MAKNLPGLKRGFHYDPVTKEMGIYVNGVQYESYGETAGRNYYVNNITGSSSNSGLSWGEAFAQPVQAITAGAAYLATQTSGNLIRNSILIQGTTTKYTPITTMPLYTNMIGVGSNPRGQAYGNTRIGSISTEDGSAGDEAGNYWYNIQFSAGGSFYAVDLGVSFSSTWDNCTFGCASDNAALTAAFRVETVGSGSSWIDCDTIYHAGTPVTGMSIVAGGGSSFNDCRFENCLWVGSTTGFYNKAYLCGGTIVTRCTIMGGTDGINDENTNSGTAANIIYSGNHVWGGTTAITCDQATGRAIGNLIVSDTTGATYTEYTDQ